MTDKPEVQQCESCEGKGADFYGTCWSCGGTGFVDADGFMAQEPLPDDDPLQPIDGDKL